MFCFVPRSWLMGAPDAPRIRVTLSRVYATSTPTLATTPPYCAALLMFWPDRFCRSWCCACGGVSNVTFSGGRTPPAALSVPQHKHKVRAPGHTAAPRAPSRCSHACWHLGVPDGGRRAGGALWRLRQSAPFCRSVSSHASRTHATTYFTRYPQPRPATPCRQEVTPWRYFWAERNCRHATCCGGGGRGCKHR